MSIMGLSGHAKWARCFNNHYKLLWRRTATATATTTTATTATTAKTIKVATTADQRTTLLHKKLDKQNEKETVTNLRQTTTKKSEKGFRKITS